MLKSQKRNKVNAKEEKENINEAELENGVKEKNKKNEKKDKSGKKGEKKSSKLFKRVVGGGKNSKADSSLESAELSSLQTSSPDQSNLTAETTSDDNEGLNITFNQTPKFTRQYDYIEEVAQQDKKHKPVGGFTYEGAKHKTENDKDTAAMNSPIKKNIGLAFNYAPGEAKKVAEAAAERRKALQEKNIDITKPVGDSKRETEKSESKGGIFSSSGSLRERLSLKKDHSKDASGKKEALKEAASKKESAKDNASKKEFAKDTVAKKDQFKDVASKKDQSKEATLNKGSSKDGILTSEQIREISKSLDKPEDSKVLFKRVQKSEEESSLNRTYTATTHRTYATDTDPVKSKEFGSPTDPGVLYSQVKKSSQPVKETEFGVDPSVVTTVTSTDTHSSSFANTSASTANSSVFSEKDHERESIDATKEFITQERRNSSPSSDKSTLAGTTPLIVKTTTKQVMVKDREGVIQNIEEKVEDLRSGAVTVSTQVNKVRKMRNFVSNIYSLTSKRKFQCASLGKF